MKKNDIVAKLIEISEIGNSFEMIESNVSHQSFGFPPSSILFVGENKSRFHELIDKLYQHSSKIKDTFTLKKFTTRFFNKFKKNFEIESNPTDSEITGFFEELKSEPVIEYYIFREIIGIKFKTDIPYITFGDFTVYNFRDHQEPVEELFEGDLDKVLTLEDANFLVKYDSKARHFEKAIEKADVFLKRFEAAINFCIGNNDKFEIGILNYKGRQRKSAFVLNKNGSLSESHNSDGPIETIAIDHKYFKSQKSGFDKIWLLISQKKFTDIESRIILAIDWIGQAINERSNTDAFLKGAIALEILLTYNDKAPITPSITHRLSESSALIIGKTKDDRIKIEKSIKSLYGRRSAIVHSGKHAVEEKDIYQIIAYVRELTMSFLTDKELSKINKMQDLYKYLKELKYS